MLEFTLKLKREQNLNIGSNTMLDSILNPHDIK